MTDGPSYELVLIPQAVRSTRTGIPEAVAPAAIEFLTGTLGDNHRRVGKSLHGELAGMHSGRRGTYRVLYRINEERREVVGVRIDHRTDAYRPS